MAEVLQAIGRSLQHISCATIGNMKEYKRWGIYEQKMDITIFVWTNANWARMFIAKFDALQKNIGWLRCYVVSCEFSWRVLQCWCIFQIVYFH